jgi:5-methylcytosine-specific restriction endonuclease McrA
MPSRPPSVIPRSRRYPLRQKPVGSYTDKAWRRLRAQVLQRDPICVRCRRHEATVADHIITRRNGGADSLDNLRGLCQPCHAGETNRFDGGWGRAPRPGKASTPGSGSYFWSVGHGQPGTFPSSREEFPRSNRTLRGNE